MLCTVLASLDRCHNAARAIMAKDAFIVFAAKEARKQWPFVVGLAGVGFAVLQITNTITDADVKASKFVHPGGHH